jgi:DNA-binding MarR family transcriptional regulator
MPCSLDYLRTVLGLDLYVLDFISQKLAVSLSTLAKQFKVPSEQMKEKVVPLVAANFVNEQRTSNDLVYTITANGVKEVERSLKKGLAAYF